MNVQEFIYTMNHYSKVKIPFFFMIDFELENFFLRPLESLDPDELKFDFNGCRNFNENHIHSFNTSLELKKQPISFKEYKRKFEIVYNHLFRGDSFLVNLTIKTPIECNYSIEEIFYSAKARYKIWFSDRFVVFSPETFVKIEGGKIYSFPMKGTIKADVLFAREKLLEDAKELAEHTTLVDLIRNDLGRISENVKVDKFRYFDRIKTHQGDLFQTSSVITGELPENFHGRLGEIIVSLLPAGSISGAPKEKTVEIIREAEGIPRGYYTGVAGLFDGNNLDSAVMIRFIENDRGQLYYRSGGGITVDSQPEKEFEEMIDKIYVPVA